MERTITLGKIDGYGSGRKNCRVDVCLELRDSDRGPCFACSAEVWNPRGTDIIMGGQCLDSIAERIHTPAFKEIVRLWRAYHLNDMHAGTPEQEAEVRRWTAAGNSHEYTAVCEHLREVGLLTVIHDGAPYTFGTAWLHEPIPDDDLARIRDIITNGIHGEEVDA